MRRPAIWRWTGWTPATSADATAWMPCQWKPLRLFSLNFTYSMFRQYENHSIFRLAMHRILSVLGLSVTWLYINLEISLVCNPLVNTNKSRNRVSRDADAFTFPCIKLYLTWSNLNLQSVFRNQKLQNSSHVGTRWWTTFIHYLLMTTSRSKFFVTIGDLSLLYNAWVFQLVICYQIRNMILFFSCSF